MPSKREVVKTLYDMLHTIEIEDFNAMETYLKQGADINFCDEEHLSLLWHVCENKDVEGVKWLIEHGANVNTESQNIQETPLMVAAQISLEIVQILLDAGADVCAKNKYGAVAATHSIAAGQDDIFHLLMRSGTDVNFLFFHQGDAYYRYFSQPFVFKYLEEHLEKLTPENVSKWKALRLKNVFK